MKVAKTSSIKGINAGCCVFLSIQRYCGTINYIFIHLSSFFFHWHAIQKDLYRMVLLEEERPFVWRTFPGDGKYEISFSNYPEWCSDFQFFVRFFLFLLCVFGKTLLILWAATEPKIDKNVTGSKFTRWWVIIGSPSLWMCDANQKYFFFCIYITEINFQMSYFWDTVQKHAR